MNKFLGFFLLTCFYISALGQNISSSYIPGKWILSNHTITMKGEQINKTEANRISYFIFSAEGTYRGVDKDKLNGKSSTYITIGKWKITEEGRKVHLYDNVPHENSVVADHDLVVSYIGGEFYLSYSYNDVVDAPQTDFYKKSKPKTN